MPQGSRTRTRRLAALIATGCLGQAMLSPGPQAFAAEPARAQATPNQTRAALPEHVVSDVNRRVEYAFRLAERGAVLSARNETIDALRLVARSLDSGNPDLPRSKMVEAALYSLDLDGKKSDQMQDKAYLLTMRERYQQAATQLTHAMGSQPAGSQALYALGRLQTTPQAALSQDERFANARAMALHLAAVQVDPNNAAAAHELGTLFAAYGQLDQAAHWLFRSASQSRHPGSWRNLAAVYERLGQKEKSLQATQQAEQLEAAAATPGKDIASAVGGVTWVDAATFAKIGADSANSPAPVVQQVAAESSGRPTPQVLPAAGAETKSAFAVPFFSRRKTR